MWHWETCTPIKVWIEMTKNVMIQKPSLNTKKAKTRPTSKTKSNHPAIDGIEEENKTKFTFFGNCAEYDVIRTANSDAELGNQRHRQLQRFQISVRRTFEALTWSSFSSQWDLRHSLSDQNEMSSSFSPVKTSIFFTTRNIAILCNLSQLLKQFFMIISFIWATL